MERKADYSNTQKYSNRKSFDGNPVPEGKVLVPFLKEKFGCHDLDGILDDYEKKDSQMRPALFYFALGKILDTNIVS